MAESGGQKGNTNGRRAKVWSQAIERALKKRSKVDQSEALDILAEKLLTLCDDGNLQALQELGNRIEGKPAQSVDMTITEYSHEAALDELENG